MPYIKQEDRTRFRQLLENFDSKDFVPKNAGELNYVITRLLHGYWNQDGKQNYQAFNDVVGVLECAKLEIYRRWTAPYEDTKIEENGDV